MSVHATSGAVRPQTLTPAHIHVSPKAEPRKPDTEAAKASSPFVPAKPSTPSADAAKASSPFVPVKPSESAPGRDVTGGNLDVKL